jgi:hypothetical protein
MSYCREVVTDLIEEYKAAERPDYVTWGSSASSSGTVNNNDSHFYFYRIKKVSTFLRVSCIRVEYVLDTN